ncbi:hypothetical protein DT076_04905 [Desertihabitans brevis]|uniref:Uncharacterized protein n=1 Tax=Desertihabitans brevis TaxID=2268447 RepID=A0A367YXW2_9ACTN|nr:hypothetical protein [Desertihabitans brevis]RCK70745.1 hypothetical protein DT076_04905 [Desertihabitans brevis]
MATSSAGREPRGLLVLAWVALVLVALTVAGVLLPALPRAYLPPTVPVELVLVLALLLVVVRGSRRAGPLLVTAAVVCLLATLLTGAEWALSAAQVQYELGAGVWTEISSTGGPVTWVSPAVCLVVAVLAVLLARGRRHESAAAVATEPTTREVTGPEARTESSEEVERRPTWEPDEATGAVWRRATDAARGDQPERDWGEGGAAHSTDQDQAPEGPTRPG